MNGPATCPTCDRVLIINDGRLILDQPIAAIGASTGASVFNVALRQPPPATTLAALAGVDGIDDLGSGRFRVHARNERLDAAGFVELAVRSGWGLYELTPHADTLEDTFIQLTRGELPALPATADTP